jgi:multidrug efflux system membrane fusion protein
MSDIPPAARPSLDARPRKRWVQPVLITVIVLVVAVGAWLAWGWTHTSSPAVKAAQQAKAKGKGGRFGAGDPTRAQPVTAVPAKLADINVVQTALGTVLAARTATVHSRVDGLLQHVGFKEGDLVQPGAFLAQVDPQPFQVALEQAEGQLARDVATLNNARLDLDRYRTLLAQDSIAGQQADQQAAQVKTLEGTVKMDQAGVDNAKLQLSYTHISAPIGGRLGLRQVDEGNIVHSSDTNGVAVITQVNPIAVIFTIPQDTLPPVLQRLRKGEKPVVDAWDREQKELLSHGALISTDNQIDVTTGTVKLKAEFPNPEGKLFPNQFVNVRMVVDTHHNVVVVPSAAIQRNAQGVLVWVVRDDSTVSPRQVNTGPTEGANTEVTSGLRDGERVITDGIDRIREGAKVEVVQPGQKPPTPPAAQDGKSGRKGLFHKGEGKGKGGTQGNLNEGKGTQ